MHFGPGLRKLFDRLVEAAPHQGPVLILGERSSGRLTGAFLLHREGRAGNPFVTPRNAQVAATGWAFWLARAEGGTLYLGDLAVIHDPAGLLAALGELEGNAPQDPRLPSPVRLVASSAVDLDELVEDQRLPLALAERFAGSVIRALPLRELRTDLPGLIDRIFPEVARHVGRPVPQLSGEVMELMQAYAWPGNFAELSACLASLALSAGDLPVDAPSLPTAVRVGARPPGTVQSGSLGDLLEQVERAAIASALRAAGFKKLHAAKALQISRPTLDKKIAQYGLKLSPK
jgi:DNA-binding NtrC family response regulator